MSYKLFKYITSYVCIVCKLIFITTNLYMTLLLTYLSIFNCIQYNILDHAVQFKNDTFSDPITHESMIIQCCISPTIFMQSCFMCSELGYEFWVMSLVVDSRKYCCDFYDTVQRDQINVAVLFWYLVKIDATLKQLNWTSHVLQGTGHTRPCITGHPVYRSMFILPG